MHMYEGPAVNVAEAVPGHRGSVSCLRNTTHVCMGELPFIMVRKKRQECVKALLMLLLSHWDFVTGQPVSMHPSLKCVCDRIVETRVCVTEPEPD